MLRDTRTASIKYRNGTIVDVVKIDSSAEYLSAMRTLAEDAKAIEAGNPSSLYALPSGDDMNTLQSSLEAHKLALDIAIDMVSLYDLFRPWLYSC